MNTIIEPSSLNTGAVVDEICDVLERSNPISGLYEYYGVANSVSGGQNYLSIFKLHEDGTTTGLTPTEFNQMNAGAGDFCYIDQRASSNNYGFMTFSKAAGARHTLVKSYFNGVVGCLDVSLNIPQLHTTSAAGTSTTVLVTAAFNSCPGFYSLIRTAATPVIATDCSSAAAPGGNNNKPSFTSVKEFEAGEIQLAPIPTSDVLFIKNIDISTIESVQLKNILGQSTKIELEELKLHESELQLNLTRLLIEPGLFVMEITLKDSKLISRKFIFII
jgi:hypothetical protein